MKSYILIIIFSILSMAGFSQVKSSHCKPCIVTEQNTFTYYPEYDTLDYRQSNVFTKIAYPLSDGKARIWVKGDSLYSKVLIYSLGNELLTQDTILLTAPYFTKIISLEAHQKKVFVSFFYKSKRIDKITSIVRLEELNNNKDSYSFIFYGCFQPFNVTKEKKPMVISKDRNKNCLFRNAPS